MPLKHLFSTVSEPSWPRLPTTLGKSNLILVFHGDGLESWKGWFSDLREFCVTIRVTDSTVLAITSSG